MARVDVFSTAEGPVVLSFPDRIGADEIEDVLLFLEISRRAIGRHVAEQERLRVAEAAKKAEIQGLS